MAALLLRLLYLIFPDLLWAFVFVDDFMLVTRKKHIKQAGLLPLLFLLVVGCPLSWKKTMTGTTNIWLGYQINAATAWAQLTPKKMLIIVPILDNLISGKAHTAQSILELLGRLQWASAAYPYMRPFLQPLYAWQRATQTAGRPSTLIRMLAQCMLSIITKPNSGRRSLPQQSKWFGFSDAAASDDAGGVGGWLTNALEPDKSEVFWFAFPVSEVKHTWAYDKGKVQRRIAALELYGTMLLFSLLVDFQQGILPQQLHHPLRGEGTPTAATGAGIGLPLQGASINLHIPLMTDNQGNAYAVLNHNTKKWPCSEILMEICAQAHAKDCHPAIQHVRRDRNTWAD
jgi:hypothetical protein